MGPGKGRSDSTSTERFDFHSIEEQTEMTKLKYDNVVIFHVHCFFKVAIPADEKKKAAREGKKARFDPAQQHTVAELQVPYPFVINHIFILFDNVGPLLIHPSTFHQAQQESDRVSKRAAELKAKAEKLAAVDAVDSVEEDDEDSENESDFVDDVEDEEEDGEDSDGEDESEHSDDGGAVAHQQPGNSGGGKDRRSKVERDSIDALRARLAVSLMCIFLRVKKKAWTIERKARTKRKPMLMRKKPINNNNSLPDS
jgi:hypothetical protein